MTDILSHAVSVCQLLQFDRDRPTAVAALTKIFLDEIERSLCFAAVVTLGAAEPCPRRPPAEETEATSES